MKRYWYDWIPFVGLFTVMNRFYKVHAVNMHLDFPDMTLYQTAKIMVAYQCISILCFGFILFFIALVVSI